MKKLHASGEDYLEAVLVLQKGKRHGKVRGCGPAPWLAVWHEFPKGCGANVVNIISQFCRKMEPGNPIRTAPYSSYKFELTPVT